MSQTPSQFTGSLLTGIQATLTTVVGGGLSTTVESLNQAQLIYTAYATGTGAGVGANGAKANQLYTDQRTLAAGQSEVINVYSPSAGTDAVGNAFAIATVKAVFVLNNGTVETDTLTVGGQGSGAAWTSPFNGASAAHVIAGGGFLAFGDPGAAGMLIGSAGSATTGANYLLKVANTGVSGHAYNYDIIVIGATG